MSSSVTSTYSMMRGSLVPVPALVPVSVPATYLLHVALMLVQQAQSRR